MQENETGMAPLPDIRDMFLILWRRRRILLMVGAVTFLLGSLVVLIRPSYYAASSTLMIEDKTVKLADFNDVTEGNKFSELTVQTEIKVLSSPGLVALTLKKLDMGKFPEFADVASDPKKLLAMFTKNLSVLPQGVSRVIEVSYMDEDPERAAQIANAHVQTYLDWQIDSKRQRVEQLREWFETKVQDLKEDVIRKSEAVNDFRAKQDLAVGKDSQELVYQQISDISNQIAPVQVHKFDLQAKLKAIEMAEKEGRPDAIADVVSSPLIQHLKEQKSLAGQQVQSLSSRYGPNHPGLRAASSQYAQVEGAIKIETRNIKTSLLNDLRATEAQETMLQERLDSLKTQADTIRIQLVTLKGLLVEQEASQKLLDGFLNNYENLQSQVSFARPDAVVVSEAVAPLYPVKPGKALLMVINLIFAGSFALAVVFALEMFGSGLANYEDIRQLGLRPLGILPKVDNPLMAARSVQNSTFKEAARRIYMAGLLETPAKALLITSALPKEGRTTLVTALAYSLMAQGHKVILVDADFLRPDLTAMLKNREGANFAEVVSGQASLREAISCDPSTGLSVLRGRKTGEDTGPVPFERMHGFFAELKKDYDYILIDTGPVLAHSEAGALANQADGILVVSAWMKTSKHDISSMLALLKTCSAPVLGLVLNQVDLDRYKDGTVGSDFLLPNLGRAA